MPIPTGVCKANRRNGASASSTRGGRRPPSGRDQGRAPRRPPARKGGRSQMRARSRLAPAARGFTQGITVTAPATESRRSASSKYQIAPIAVGSSPCRAPVINNRVPTLPFPEYRRPERDRSVPVPFRPSLMSTRLVRSFGGMGKKKSTRLEVSFFKHSQEGS